MEAPRILVLTTKRTEIMGAIGLLEMRSRARNSLAVSPLLERLKMKLEWLDKCIASEQQRSGPVCDSALAQRPTANNAA